MLSDTSVTSFRVELLFYEELDSIVIVPLVGRSSNLPSPDAQVSGQLPGCADLRRLIDEIPLDSFVTRKQLSDVPSPAFLYTFHLMPPEDIIAVIQDRFRRREEAQVRILNGEQLSADLERSLAPFQSAVLGSSDLTIKEGVKRLWEWLGKPVRDTAGPSSK